MSLEWWRSLVNIRRYTAFEMVYISMSMVLKYEATNRMEYSMRRCRCNSVCIHRTTMVLPSFSRRRSAHFTGSRFVGIGAVIVEIFGVWNWEHFMSTWDSMRPNDWNNTSWRNWREGTLLVLEYRSAMTAAAAVLWHAEWRTCFWTIFRRFLHFPFLTDDTNCVDVSWKGSCCDWLICLCLVVIVVLD